MKKAIIAMLVCVNAGLLLALILGKGVPSAQAYNGSIMPHNTIMVTGQVRDNEDVVYILDMASERLAAFEFTKAKKLRPIGSRDLKMDLK